MMVDRVIYINWLVIVLVGCIMSSDVMACNLPTRANKYLFPIHKSDHSLRILTYNVRGNLPIDQKHGNSWGVRKLKIKSLIDLYKPDLVVLQEVEIGYMNDLIAMFSGHGVIAFDANLVEKDSVILFSASRLQALKGGCFWFSEDPFGSMDLKPLWDSNYPRMAIYQEFQDCVTSKKLFVFGVHFPSIGEKARLNCAELLIQQQAGIAGNLPVIVAGDFNLFLGSNSENVYQTIVSQTGFKDVRSVAQANHYGPDGTWIGWPYDDYAAPSGCIGIRLDHIFVKGVQIIQDGVLNCKINAAGNLVGETDSEFDSLTYPSDHLPVIADIYI